MGKPLVIPVWQEGKKDKEKKTNRTPRGMMHGKSKRESNKKEKNGTGQLFADEENHSGVFWGGGGKGTRGANKGGSEPRGKMAQTIQK